MLRHLVVSVPWSRVLAVLALSLAVMLVTRSRTDTQLAFVPVLIERPAPPRPPVAVPIAPPVPSALPAPAVPSRPSVSVDALLQGLDPVRPGPTRTDNPHLDAASWALREPDPAALDQVVGPLLAASYDPANAAARFIAACSLAQHGLHAASRSVLGGLVAAKDCPACTDALLNLGEPRCAAIDTAQVLPGGRPAASPLRIAAEAVLSAINSGDDGSIARYLEGTSEIHDTCSVCDGEVVNVVAYSPETFRAFVRAAERRYAEGPYIYRRPMLLFCDGGCCSGPLHSLSHTAITVTSICFRGPADRPVLASIHTLSG